MKWQFFAGEAGDPQLCAVGRGPKQMAQVADLKARAEVGKFFQVTIVEPRKESSRAIETSSDATLTGVMVVDHDDFGSMIAALACVRLAELKGLQILSDLSQEENDALLEQVVAYANKQLAN